jgi:hypothetical protein
MYIRLGNPYTLDKNGGGVQNEGFYSEAFGEFRFEIFGFRESELAMLLEKAGRRWHSGRFNALFDYALLHNMMDFDDLYRLRDFAYKRDMASLLADEVVSRLMGDAECIAFIDGHTEPLHFYSIGGEIFLQEPNDDGAGAAQPAPINNTPYTFDQIAHLIALAWLKEYITSEDFSHLLDVLHYENNADKVLAFEGMREALADDEFLIFSGMKEQAVR